MKKIIFPLVLSVTIAGCGGETSDGVIGRDDGDTGLATELEGVWLKACGSVDESDSETLHDIVELTFTNNKVSSSIRNFIDSDCLIPYSDSPNPKAIAEFEIGDEIIAEGGLEVTEIDSQIDRSEGAPFIANAFDIYLITNGDLYFGNSNCFNDGSTAALRPDVVNYNRLFERQ